jgi:integrase
MLQNSAQIYYSIPNQTKGGLFAMSRGHVRQDKRSKMWYVDLYHQGQRYRIFKYLGVMPCPNEESAKELKLILNDEINKDPHGWTPARHKQSSPLHFKEYSKAWLETLEVSNATMHDYLNSLNNHILPKLGKEYLPDITEDRLKIFQKKIKREPKGKKNVMDVLRMILKSARKSGFISKVPDFPPLKVEKPRIRYIKQKDQWRILAAIPPEHRYIFTFIVLTGCRPSEARAFRKVDIKDDHIIFAKTFGRGEELKKVKGFNEAPFPLYGALKELLDSVPSNLTPFVFIHPKTGGPYSKNFNRIWNKACTRAGVLKVRLGINRHSFGCNAINSGVDKSVIQKLLRHTDSKMTDRYAEYSTETLKITLDNVFSLNRQRAVSKEKDDAASD